MFETYVDALMPKYTFPGQYESLAQIAALIRQATQELGLSSLDAYTVEMAVDEACTNIIEHAYGGEGLGEIELEYKIEADSLIITLRDHGKPFNPKKVRPPGEMSLSNGAVTAVWGFILSTSGWMKFASISAKAPTR